MILNTFEFRRTQVYTNHQLKLSGSRIKTCYCKFFKVVEGMQGNAFAKVRYLFSSKMFFTTAANTSKIVVFTAGAISRRN